MSNGWRVWCAFEDKSVSDDSELWRALFKQCRTADGRLDVEEYERWCDVFIWYQRGLA